MSKVHGLYPLEWSARIRSNGLYENTYNLWTYRMAVADVHLRRCVEIVFLGSNRVRTFSYARVVIFSNICNCTRKEVGQEKLKLSEDNDAGWSIRSSVILEMVFTFV